MAMSMVIKKRKIFPEDRDDNVARDEFDFSSSKIENNLNDNDHDSAQKNEQALEDGFGTRAVKKLLKRWFHNSLPL